MKLSIEEGRAIAERQAWAETGKKHRWWFTRGRRYTPRVLILVALGAAGYGVHALAVWAGTAIETVRAPAAHAGPPAGLWIVAVLLCATTVLGLRAANRAIRFLPAAATYLGLLIAWCGLIGYGLGTL
jgi:hypothetical protein